MPRENTIVNSGTRELHKRGAWTVNIHGHGAGRNGTPDQLAIYKGRPLVLEYKQPGRKPRPLQTHELTMAARAGATTAVITHVDQLRQLLDTIDQELDA